MRKILLNKSKGKESVNNSNIIPVNLNRDVSLFHDEIFSDTIDTMQVYNNEKDNSNKHRFIFTLYPVFSNVLFNKISEIVYKEGSDEAEMLENSTHLSIKDKNLNTVSSQTINRIQAIRNTEYSNKEFEFSYHCGADIFNNHLLRSKEDITVQKRDTYSAKQCTVYTNKRSDADTTINIDAFNTIGDYARTFFGKNIMTKIPKSPYYTYLTYNNMKAPLYLYDTIKTFKESYNDGIKRKDGWIGFTNPSTLHIPVRINKDGSKYYVNKCLNNKDACQFIDMSPERDLFYFTPKKNKYRNRIENNWDYVLTYPYKSEYNDGLILKGKYEGLPLESFGEDMYREYNSSNGVTLVMFRSSIRHNLTKGSYVLIKFSKGKEIACEVVSIGTINGKFKERYFSIRKDDFIDYITDENKPERFAKIVNGFECEYYFRKFKKLSDKQNSTLTKLAFSDTIYGDEVSQIVFTDDIDISNYVDNRNRPLTEIYLTIIKANRGHSLWYDENKSQSKDIEFSHVFGKVSSGINMPEYASLQMPSVRHQHNIDIEKANDNDDGVIFQKSSNKLESNITIKSDEFYGDLVEFNPITLIETTIERVIHRFNTAQRETSNEKYNTIYYDEIESDIFDAYYINKSESNTIIRQYALNEGYANLAPEGYIYNPHYRIKIGEFSQIVNQLSDITMKVSEPTLSNDNSKVTFKTYDNYTLLPNDIISMMDKNNFENYQYKVESYSIEPLNGYYICEATYMNNKPGKDSDLNNFIFFKHNLDIPSYSYMLPDGTGRHLWRDITKPSEYMFTSDLYDTPFTNGSFYHHANINFLVRRQDPFKTYGMYPQKDGLQIENNFEIPSIEVDYSNDEYINENESILCF